MGVRLILRVRDRKISSRAQNGLWGRGVSVRTTSYIQLNPAHPWSTLGSVNCDPDEDQLVPQQQRSLGLSGSRSGCYGPLLPDL